MAEGYILGRKPRPRLEERQQVRQTEFSDTCPSRIFMRPVENNNDGVLERLEIRRPGPVRLAVLVDRQARPGPKTGAFAMDDNNPGRTTEAA